MEKLRMGVKSDSNDSPVASETVWHDAPHSWTRTSLRRVSRLQYGDSLADAERQEGDISVFGSNGPVGYHNQANMIAPAIVVGRKGSFGKVTFAPFGGFAIDTTYFIDKRSSRQNLRWLYYSLTTLGLDQISQDTGVPGLSREKAYEARLAVPPLATQRAIANYLDEKTADLDALIEKKRKVLDLLAEERAALINQVVTKGLNPSVPMKDSGIPWIGEIPAHWAACPLYARYTVQLGKMLDASTQTGQTTAPYLRNADIQWGNINVENLPTMDFSSSDRRKFNLLKGDILTCEGGANASVVGKSAMWNDDLDECYYQKALHRIRSRNEHQEPRFLFYALWAAFSSGVFTLDASANIFHLTAEKLRVMRFPFPNRPEQEAIASFLDERLSDFTKAKDRIEDQLSRLQEYRQALITAAVTGQIDSLSVSASEVTGT